MDIRDADDSIAEQAPDAAAAEAEKTSAEDERRARIEAAMDQVRPFLRQDGGDIHLVDVDGKNIYVRMSGACVGCQLATVTLGGVQKRLIEALGEPVRIIPAEMRDRMPGASKPKPAEG